MCKRRSMSTMFSPPFFGADKLYYDFAWIDEKGSIKVHKKVVSRLFNRGGLLLRYETRRKK